MYRSSRSVVRRAFRRLWCERLESRCLLAALAGDEGLFRPVIVAGDPNGNPPDSPAARVDANEHGWFAGVGSLEINTRRGTYLCTGTAIDSLRVLTAAHCVDINNDGRSDAKDGILSIKFNVNLDTDSPVDQVDLQTPAASWRIHPDYTGFARPSVNDDLAVITLASPLPATVPTYALASSDLTVGTELVMVGYGRSGDGINGYTTGASFTVKRVGGNVVDAFYGQDDRRRPLANEVFRFDFDSPDGSNGPLGGPSLGNTVETTLGGGDSGGPSFILRAGADPTDPASYLLVGVNTFTQGNAPYFGSLGGGINVFPYRDWILSGTTSGGGGGGPRGPGAGPQLDAEFVAIASEMWSAFPAEMPLESGMPPGLHVTSSIGAAVSIQADVSIHPLRPMADRHDLLRARSFVVTMPTEAGTLQPPASLGFKSSSAATEADDASALAVDAVLSRDLGWLE